VPVAAVFFRFSHRDHRGNFLSVKLQRQIVAKVLKTIETKRKLCVRKLKRSLSTTNMQYYDTHEFVKGIREHGYQSQTQHEKDNSSICKFLPKTKCHSWEESSILHEG
jgi:anionic cell wall polymer biosynthesis LytR-Cps2A-Psr (LCP) family protein